MFGIACHAIRCTAAGALTSGVRTPFGEIVTLTAGKLTDTQTVAAAGGFDDVGTAGGTTVEVGPGYSGTAVTTS
jgi:hypothetical protein